MVTADQVEAFRKEMTDAGAKFEIITYPGAKHGFTNPDAGKAGMDALAYNADADKKSWAAMLATFKQGSRRIWRLRARSRRRAPLGSS